MPRVILHVDMNSFFASVEQAANPSLRGQPIAVIGSKDRTVVLTASYAAKRFGVKTGNTVFEARKRCPGIRFVTSDPDKYMHTSRVLMQLFTRYTPQVEVSSIDEAFLDLTGSLYLFGTARRIAELIKRDVASAFNLTCSAGIAPNKLLAKLAAEMEKPDGLVIIRPEEVPGCLDRVPVGALCGVGPRTEAFLASRGIRTCGDVQRLPEAYLARCLGVSGTWLHHAAFGRDDSPVDPLGVEIPPKSVGHSMTLEADLDSRAQVEVQLQHMAEMVGRRMRSARLAGRTVTVTIRFSSFASTAKQKTGPHPVCLGLDIFALARQVWQTMAMPEPVRLVGVSVSNLEPMGVQLPLFAHERRAAALALASDAVNDRHGEFTVFPAALLLRCQRERTIAPSWRPDGLRQAIRR